MNHYKPWLLTTINLRTLVALFCAGSENTHPLVGQNWTLQRERWQARMGMVIPRRPAGGFSSQFGKLQKWLVYINYYKLNRDLKSSNHRYSSQAWDQSA